MSSARGSIVFVGPSLDPARAASLAPETTIAPPAQRGDIRRAVLDGWGFIGLIDGYFEHLPAVWHKEILFALSEGCTVVGASSMGALRAAEMGPLGMKGVGRVHDLVVSGVLSDADVALAHGPAPDFARYSEPHADVHFTVGRAVELGEITPEGAELLLAASRALFYPERVYPEITGTAVKLGLSPGMARAFLDGLGRFRVEAKEEDAVVLLEGARRWSEGERTNPVPPPVFLATSHFRAMGEEEDRWRRIGDGAPAMGAVVREALLDPVVGPAVFGQALRNRLGAQNALQAGIRPTQQLVDETSDHLRRTHGLADAGALEHWLEGVGLDLDGYAGLVERLSLARWSENRITGDSLEEHLLDALRVSGHYPDVARRALEKSDLLESSGWDPVARGTTGDSTDSTDSTGDLEWFFREFRGEEIPADIGHFARTSGFGSPAALLSAIRRERAFRALGEADAGSPVHPVGGSAEPGTADGGGADPPREWVGPWELVARVARGGVARVHEARGGPEMERVALKLLREDLDPEGPEARSMEIEARVLGRVAGPHLISCRGSGVTDQGRPFLVLDWAERGSLSDRLSDGVARDPWAVGRIVEHLVSAVASVHAAGLVHCDIHPGNLLVLDEESPVPLRDPSDGAAGPRLLESEERVVLADFGSTVGPGAGERPPRIFGTPRFRAPEQLSSTAGIGPFTDIWGATMVLWSLVTGDSPPWPDEIGELLEAMPPHWREVVGRGLDPDGGRRHRTITEWGDAVASALDTDVVALESGRGG